MIWMLSDSICSRCASRIGALSAAARGSRVTCAVGMVPCTFRSSRLLRSSGFGRRRADSGAAVQATFLLVLLLPPPAPGALRFARRHRTRAGGAADRQKPPVVQRIVWNAVGADEIGHATARPIQQWTEFEEAAHRIDRGIRRSRPFHGLLGADAGDPARGADKCAADGLNLSHCAATLSRLDRGTETVDSVLRHPRFEASAIGDKCADAPAIALLRRGPQLKDLREQASGIERDDVDRQIMREDR